MTGQPLLDISDIYQLNFFIGQLVLSRSSTLVTRRIQPCPINFDKPNLVLVLAVIKIRPI